MRYISIDYLLRMFPEDSFLDKLIKSRVEKAKEPDYIIIPDIISDKSCTGCDKLFYYNDGHVGCASNLEHACIINNFKFKNT